MTKVILTRIPSKLIRLALDDLRICESQPEKYEIDMGAWHRSNGSKCSVCLAGAVMANTTNGNVTYYYEHARELTEDEVNKNCYLFLTAMRHATIFMGIGCFHIGACPISWTKEIPLYEDDKEGFHKSLNELAEAFEASGQ